MVPPVILPENKRIHAEKQYPCQFSLGKATELETGLPFISAKIWFVVNGIIGSNNFILNKSVEFIYQLNAQLVKE